MVLCDLHPNYRCHALDDALVFYNTHRPDQQVEPTGIGYMKLVHMDRINGQERT